MNLRRLPLPVIVWLVALMALAGTALHTPVATDLSAFMPSAPSPRQQLLVDQFKQGIIARLMIVGIEGGDATERARLSGALARTLGTSPEFVGVQNGGSEELGRDRDYFFRYRYLLSPATTAGHYSEAGLRDAINATLAEISGSAGMLLKQLLPRDPTGEIRTLLEGFDGDQQPPTTEGVWSTRDGSRALLLLQTRADGSDLEAQARAIALVHESFEHIPQRAQGTRVLLTGTGVYSVQSRALIEHEVRRLALASLALVVALLMLVYRSWRLLALNLMPMLTGTLAGIAAVHLAFGTVHGITLGFGTTMIGEAVDYAIYLFVQRPEGAARRAFWRTLWLGLFTSLAGFLALLGAGFPGLVQLGLYSTAGLVAAVLVTRFVLPPLMPAQLMADGRPGDAIATATSRAGRAAVWAVRHAPRLRAPMVLLSMAMAAVVIWHADGLWNRSISALNPVPLADQQLGTELQRDFGASDLRYLAVLHAPDAERGLQLSERASLALSSLVGEGVLASFSAPSQVLPSRQSQALRQAALPEPAALARNLEAALKGSPLRADRLHGFLEDVQANRVHAPLGRGDLNGTAASMLYDSLIVQRAGDVLVLLPLRPPRKMVSKAVSRTAGKQDSPDGEVIEPDLNRIDTTLRGAGLDDVTVVDLLGETNALFDSYLHEALAYSGLGCLAIVLILAFTLRSAARVLRVVLPLACAVVCVVGLLQLMGTGLTILHLVGLLLVVAIGSNYALFFDTAAGATSHDPQGLEQQRTLISLLTANMTIVGSFGMLAISSVPVLSILGVTVGLGTVLALVFSAAMSRHGNAAPR